MRAVSPAECARRGRRAVTNMRGRPRCELPLDLQENARAPRHSQWGTRGCSARPGRARRLTLHCQGCACGWLNAGAWPVPRSFRAIYLSLLISRSCGNCETCCCNDPGRT